MRSQRTRTGHHPNDRDAGRKHKRKETQITCQNETTTAEENRSPQQTERSTARQPENNDWGGGNTCGSFFRRNGCGGGEESPWFARLRHHKLEKSAGGGRLPESARRITTQIVITIKHTKIKQPESITTHSPTVLPIESPSPIDYHRAHLTHTAPPINSQPSHTLSLALVSHPAMPFFARLLYATHSD